MRRHRNAKIIATLGPASSSPEIVRSLFDAGADVFRLNFSHKKITRNGTILFAPSSEKWAVPLASSWTCRGPS